jgi:hypothetical protein
METITQAKALLTSRLTPIVDPNVEQALSLIYVCRHPDCLFPNRGSRWRICYPCAQYPIGGMACPDRP